MGLAHDERTTGLSRQPRRRNVDGLAVDRRHGGSSDDQGRPVRRPVTGPVPQGDRAMGRHHRLVASIYSGSVGSNVAAAVEWRVYLATLWRGQAKPTIRPRLLARHRDDDGGWSGWSVDGEDLLGLSGDVEGGVGHELFPAGAGAHSFCAYLACGDVVSGPPGFCFGAGSA